MATYPTHGVHLRQRHPNRWLLLAIVVVAALVGVGAWALVNHFAGGTTEPTTGSATLTSRDVATKYIAALDNLDPSALQPIVAKNAVSIDWAYGSSTFHGAATLEGNWAGVFLVSGHTVWRGSLRAATPNWAAVTWRWHGTTNPLTNRPFKMNGLSILNIQNGKIVRETYYWDVPGRNPGIAATVGRKFATALGRTDGRTLGSLYSKGAVAIDMAESLPLHHVNSLIWGHWQTPHLTPLHASRCCAGPSMRLDNGRTRPSWAVVNWVAKDASPGGGKVSGISILQLKNGQIVRETMYY